MALQDWIVPVHYLRRAVRFPALKPASRTSAGLLVGALNQLRGQRQQRRRDRLAGGCRLFRRPGRRVLRAGGGSPQSEGGGGPRPRRLWQTELAKAFGRWWQATGGVERPEWVIFHSFEPGVASFGLEGVISAIALEVYGWSSPSSTTTSAAASCRAAQRAPAPAHLGQLRVRPDHGGPSGSTPGQAKGKGGRRSLDLVSDGGGGRPCRWLSSTPVAPKTRQRSAPSTSTGDRHHQGPRRPSNPSSCPMPEFTGSLKLSTTPTVAATLAFSGGPVLPDIGGGLQRRNRLVMDSGIDRLII